MTQKEFIEFLNTPQKDRDIKWEEDFLQNFPQSKLTVAASQPQVGPDQFPYMFVEIKEDSNEPAMNLLKWVSENGIGLAVNPTKSYPDFVFTFGMVWNFIQNGKFLTQPLTPHVHGPGCNHDHTPIPKEEEHVHGPDCNHEHHKNSSTANSMEQTHEHKLYVGTPSEGFLPPPIRTILKEFLKQQGVMAPKVIMLSPDKINFDLCFSIEAFGSPAGNEHEGILQALSWFLPAHYSLALVSENGLPAFEEL